MRAVFRFGDVHSIPLPLDSMHLQLISISFTIYLIPIVRSDEWQSYDGDTALEMGIVIDLNPLEWHECSGQLRDVTMDADRRFNPDDNLYYFDHYWYPGSDRHRYCHRGLDHSPEAESKPKAPT